MKMTLSKKMYGMIGIISVVMLVISGIAIYGIRSILGAYESLVRVDAARYSAAMDAQVALGKAVVATKNYMTRMEQEYTDEFKAQIGKLKTSIQAMERHARTTDEKEIAVMALEELNQYEKQGNELIAAVLTGKDAVSVDTEFQGIDRNLFVTLEEMGDATLKAQNGNFERDASSAKATQAMFLAVALIGVALAWVFAALTIRKVTRSVVVVSEVTGKASEGDLSQDVPVLTTDEVGQMAQGFNKMMEDLRRIAGEIKGMTNTLASSSEE
ncbi:MAG: HAMP domain-containing protein, partial [Thermodesulfobacteriota bacterium]